MDKQPERQPLDDFFRNQLKETTVNPDPHVWNRLHERLAEIATGTTTETPIQKIGTNTYIKAFLAVAACLLLLLFGYNQLPDQSGRESLSAGPEATSERRQKNRRPIKEYVAAVITLADKDKKTIAPESVERSRNQKGQRPQTIDRSERPERNFTLPVVPEGANLEAKMTLAATKPDQPEAEPEKKPVSVAERTLLVQVTEPYDGNLTTESIHNKGPAHNEDEIVPRRKTVTRVLRQLKRLKEGELMARANEETSDEESGFVNRLIHSGRFKDQQDKQQK